MGSEGGGQPGLGLAEQALAFVPERFEPAEVEALPPRRREVLGIGVVLPAIGPLAL